MPLSPGEVQRVAHRMLADYDGRRPNSVFAELGSDWLDGDDACAVQRAVAELRRARNERCLGYKVGCVSTDIRRQLGLHQPVRGYLWASEAHPSGCHLALAEFANLAIEGEIGVRLNRDLPAGLPAEEVACRIECWFPVIELHNLVFRGARPTSQELIAANALHAGFVAPSQPVRHGVAGLESAEIRIQLDGELVQCTTSAALPGGPLGSLQWLASSLELSGEALRAGELVLTGSPGPLIPVSKSCSVVVGCEGQRVELRISES